MASTKKEIPVTQQFVIKVPDQEGGVFVTHSVWNQYMDRLRRCSLSTSSLESGAWASFGGAIGLFASTVTFFFSVEFFQEGNPKWPVIIAEIVLFILFVIFGIAWWAMGRLAKTQKQYHADMVQIIVEDMQLLGDKYKPSEETRPVRDAVMEQATVTHSVAS
jgi:hypothetical protein